MVREASEVMDENETVAEERLWQAVIASTVQEWVSGPLRQSREAERFLFHDEKDFRLVCQSAGMDAEHLRTRLLKVRDRPASGADANRRHN